MNVRVDTSDGPPVVIATMTSHEARRLATDMMPYVDDYPGGVIADTWERAAVTLLYAAQEIDDAV